MIVFLLLFVFNPHESFADTTYTAGNVQFKVIPQQILLLASGPQGVALAGGLAQLVPPTENWDNCLVSSSNSQVCLQLASDVSTLIQARQLNTVGTSQCTEVVRTTKTFPELKDCFQMGEDHWYGEAEAFTQSWPIEKVDRTESPFVTGDSFKDSQHRFSGVIQRYWLSSRGVVISVDNKVPLFVSRTNKLLCLSAKYQPPYVISMQELTPSLTLNYTICTGSDVKQVHLDYITKYGIKPSGIPDLRMIKDPIWSTWAEYSIKIDQNSVLQFAQTIAQKNFTASQVEIDDEWETCYGEYQFNMTKFPDPNALVKQLEALGFRVTLWIHPFLNLNCPLYATAAKERYLITERGTGKAAVSTWWNGKGSYVDFTNPAAVKWWSSRITNLQEKYGIYSFKFDAGETTYLPDNYALSASVPAKLSPNGFTTAYVNAASKFGDAIETRVAHETYRNPNFVRMLDKDSKWDLNNGLKTLIPTALTFGILGYPYVLPDMVGGNAYNGLPDKELFIRWLQVNLFMPSIQFSIVPWKYGNDTVELVKKLLTTRQEFIELITLIVKEAAEYGYPIIRPLWWIAPTDPVSQTIDSEFLVGETLLVAPVLEPGARSRDIYLPPGQWLRDVKGKPIQGPVWLNGYPADLDTIPYFVKA